MGQSDKTGQRIFEGDILKDSRDGNFDIWYDGEFCQFLAGHFAAGRTGRIRPLLNHGTTRNLEVIGNIHDNPELLEATP